MRVTTFLFPFILLLLWRCSSQPAVKADDQLLAQVYNKNLYASELADVVPEGTNPTDSSLLVTAFVQRWIRDQLLMYEAERNIPKDLNIDELVRDYRASLAAEKAAQYAASNAELEQRLRVLEQIVTDGGVQTAAQIEALRDQKRLEAGVKVK